MSTASIEFTNGGTTQPMTADQGPSRAEDAAKAIGRPSISQHYRAFEGAVGSQWIPLPEHHPLRKSMEFLSGGLVTVVADHGDLVEITIGSDLGIEIDFQITGSPGLATFSQHGKHHFDVSYERGIVEHFRYCPFADAFYAHRLQKDVVRSRIGGEVLTFAANGLVAIGPLGSGRCLQGGTASSITLSDDSILQSDDDANIFHPESGREFRYCSASRRWVELFVATPSWAFGEILNAESTLSVEVLGLITAYANGAIQLWGTYSFARWQPIDEVLVNDSGECQLWVHRAAGSDFLYLHEDGSPRPTGVLRFVPQYFVGKDDKTLYAAWLYAASDSSIPLGHAGISPLGTLVLLLVLLLGLSSLVISTATTLLAFCVILVFLSLTLRELFLRTRAMWGSN